MGLINGPFCSYCNEEIESASHFLCHCNYFAMIRTAIWGKPSLHPNDIDYATVRDIVRFTTKLPISIWYFRGWLMGPLCGLSLHGSSGCPAPKWNGNGMDVWHRVKIMPLSLLMLRLLLILFRFRLLFYFIFFVLTFDILPLSLVLLFGFKTPVPVV